MKENKAYQIKFRLTESQKAQVLEYCAAHALTVSEAMRLALTELLNGGKQNDK